MTDTTSTAFDRLPVETLECIAMHVGAHAALPALAMTSRRLRAAVWGNHRFMRTLFAERWGWDSRAPATLPAPPGIEWNDDSHDDSWPSRDWYLKQDVPHDERASFDAFVRRLVVLTHAPWCSLCHRVYGGDDARLYSIWALGARVCAPCLHDNLVSSRTLLEQHGVGMFDGDDLAIMARLMTRFYVVDDSSAIANKLKHAFAPGCADAVAVYFWRPHVRALQQPRWADRAAAARATLAAVFARRGVQLAMCARRGGKRLRPQAAPKKRRILRRATGADAPVARRLWPTDAAEQDALFERLHARHMACTLFACACARAREMLLVARAALPPHMLEFALYHQRAPAYARSRSGGC